MLQLLNRKNKGKRMNFANLNIRGNFSFKGSVNHGFSLRRCCHEVTDEVEFLILFNTSSDSCGATFPSKGKAWKR